MRTGEGRLSGPGTRRAATQWRSRAQPGLPGTRAGLAGSAAHSRATGRGHRQRRRASGDRSTSRRRSRRQQGDGPPAGAGGSAVQGRASRDQGGICRQPRETGRTARPRGRSACGAAIGRRTLSGCAAVRQCASSAPLHQVSSADPRQPIVTARPRPGNGARGREAWLRAVERGRAASPVRGACSPPCRRPFGIFLVSFRTNRGIRPHDNLVCISDVAARMGFVEWGASTTQ